MEKDILGGFFFHQITCAMTFIPLKDASHHNITPDIAQMSFVWCHILNTSCSS